MEYIISEDISLELDFETSIAIGNFDGLHLAHQRLIRSALDFAKRSMMRSVVLTFRPHTAHLFDPFGSPHLIMSYEEKIEEISRLGVDIIIEQRFDHRFASLTKEEFLYGYLKRIGAKAVFVGYDFSFSRDRKANQEDLREFGRRTGAFIEIMEPQYLDGIRISSTVIRNLIMEGNITLANRLLGRRYYISGSVVRGKGLGRNIGVATANIPIIKRLIPREGVYITITEVDGRRYRSISNVGKTSLDGDVTLLETHILDFDGELYNRRIRVEFLKFIRPELKFSSLEELKRTIYEDIGCARAFFKDFDENI